jgi:nicotinamide-nucleotide amidase
VSDDPDPDPGSDSADPLATRVGDRLRTVDADLAVAESLTGGLVGSRLTDVPGTSDFLDRVVVAYSNDAKIDALGVSREVLDADGAVSAAVARGMARGARDAAGTTWGVSTTGVAGPTGGTDTKPVGRTHVGVAYAAPWGTGDSFARAECYTFDGDRRAVKCAAAGRALRDLLAAVDAPER